MKKFAVLALAFLVVAMIGAGADASRRMSWGQDSRWENRSAGQSYTYRTGSTHWGRQRPTKRKPRVTTTTEAPLGQEDLEVAVPPTTAAPTTVASVTTDASKTTVAPTTEAPVTTVAPTTEAPVTTAAPGSAVPTNEVMVSIGGFFLPSSLRERDVLIILPEYVGDPAAIVDFVNAPNLTLTGRPIPEDIIDLSRLDADTTTSGDDAFTLVDSFSGTPGELVAGTLDGTGYGRRYVSVSGDMDGDGVAEFTISVGVDTLGRSLSGPWADNLIL